MYKLNANDTDIDKKRVDEYIDYITQYDDHKDVKNIAVMGPYGSGKSTILESLKKRNPSKYVNINMIEFSDEINDLNGIPDASVKTQKKEEMVQKIEQSIVQQLIYQEKEKTLPFSKLKKEYPTLNSVLMNIFLFLTLCCGLLFFEIYDLVKYVINFTCSTKSIVCLLYFVGMVGIGCYLLFGFILYFYKNFRLVKINYSKKNTSIEYERYESVYNKNLDELLYFFKESSYDTVIFEDIDRYNDLLFFSHLRELNSILNKSKSFDKKITFIYAIKDDLFKDKDKTKFFDYIVPIVPIMDYSNSAEKFKQHLSGQNFDNETINLLSSFVSDYRMLKNICNEYVVYKNIKNSEIFNNNALLAILTFKNLYPKEFSRLQLNNSIFDYIFHKVKVHAQLKAKALQDEMNKYTNALKDDYNFADPKYLVLGLIKNIVETHRQNTSGNIYSITGVAGSGYQLQNIFNCNVKWSEIENISQLYFHSSNDKFSIDLNQYHKLQFEHYKYLYDNKEYLFEKTSEDLIENINRLDGEINLLSAVKASTFYSDNPNILNEVIEQYYSDEKHKKDEDKKCQEEKDEKFIVFIKSLILNDLIGENYNKYISLTHGQAKSENDNLFIHNVSAKIENDFLLELTDLDYIFEQLKTDIFESRYSFNIHIIKYLKKHNIKGLNTLLNLNSDRLYMIYKNLEIDNKNTKIISATLKNSSDIDGLLNSEKLTTREFWFKILILMDHKDFKKLSLSDQLKEEIKNYDLIKLYQIKDTEIKNLINNCKYLEIKFNNIKGVDKNQKLFEEILKEKMYKFSYKNLRLLNRELSFEKLISNESTKKYIEDNLDLFLELIIVNKIATIQSEEFNQLVLKTCENREFIKQYIIQNNVYIHDIASLTDEEELKALCVNKENTLGILKHKNMSKEIKSLLICELQKHNKDLVKDYTLDLFDTIKSEKIYTYNLLTNKIYLEIFKSEKIQPSDRIIILDNIIEICDAENLLKIIKIYNAQFKNLKKEIIITKNSTHIKLVNKLIELGLFEKISETNDKIVLKKTEKKKDLD